MPDWTLNDIPWLSQGSPSDSFIKGSQAGSAIASNMRRGQEIQQRGQIAAAQFALDQQHLDLQQQEQTARIAAQGVQNQVAEFNMMNKYEGLKQFADWHKSYYENPNTPLPSNPIALEQAIKVQNHVSKIALENKRLMEDTEFNKQAIKLKDGTAFSAITSMQDPVLRRQALAVALEAQSVQEKNQAAIAGAAAIGRGDTVTTTINDKGVTEKYSPKTTKADVSMVEPKIIPGPENGHIILRPNASALYIRHNEEKPHQFTPEQLQKFGEKLPDSSPDKKLISDYVSGVVRKQVGAKDPRPVLEQPKEQSQPTVLPFPKSKEDAKVGSVYETKHGNLKWDGQAFVPVN